MVTHPPRVARHRFLAVLAFAACGPTGGADAKPAGTPTDPVEVCQEADQVCRYDGSQLGVCIVASGSGPEAKLVCAPQH